MTYQTRLNYSETLIRQAVFSFWKKSLGPGVLIALAVTVAAAAILVFSDDDTWIGAALGVLIALYLCFLATIYVVHLRNAMAKFQDLGEEAIATFAADADTFTLSSSIGSSTMRWSTIKEVWRFSKFWLILFSKAQFVTIPLENMDQDMQLFVLEKARANGTKVWSAR